MILNPSTSQIVILVKSGAFPTKDKKHFLINYAKSQFELKEYKDVSTLPKLKELEEKWDININIIKSKEQRLQIYNQKRKIEYQLLQQEKYKKHTLEFTEKYLSNEKFWEFEALSIFINNNPFERIYNIITPFQEIEDGAKGVIIGIVSNIVKKTDRHGKQFAYVSIYSLYGLIDIICWHSQYKEYQDILKRGNQLALLCKKKDEKAICESIKTYDQWLIDKKLK
jgi:DNA polymerase-3 subunit alpha